MRAKGTAAKDKEGTKKPSADPYYPSSGKNFYDENELKGVLTEPLDKVVDSMTSFTLWLDGASPGTPQPTGIVQHGQLKMAVEAPLSSDLTLTTTVTAPIDEGAKAEPVATTVVTDNDTGEVLAKETGTCPNAHAVLAVAIEQTVGAVLEAREDAPLAKGAAQAG